MIQRTKAGIFSAILAFAMASAAAAAAVERPNILFFFTDDQRNTTMGCAGHPVIQTPNVDQLASEGVRFENAFVSTSTCWISRACLFTGCYERRHLYHTKSGPLDPTLCATSYFAVLKKSGYRTGHLGKEHVNLDDASAAAMFDVRRPLRRNPYFKKQADGSRKHTTDIMAEWAAEFLAEQPADQPFCLTVSFNAPHAEDGDRRPGIGHYPWPPGTDGMYDNLQLAPPRLSDPAIHESQPDFLKKSINRTRFFWRWDTPEKYQVNMRAYFRMLSGIDQVVGRLRQVLEQKGMADNTVIIYSADNGYYLGDRGFAGKWTHYDESLRVPLIIFDPRQPRDSRGRVASQMVLNSDIASTIIELAGQEPPKSHTGRSLLPLLRGEVCTDWRTDFLCEFLNVTGSIPKWEGVRDQDWTYARYYVNGTKGDPLEFLHDLKADPDQKINLADAAAGTVGRPRSDVLARMRARADDLVAENGPTMKSILEQSKRKTSTRANRNR